MFSFLKRKSFIRDAMLFILLLSIIKIIIEKQYRKNASTKTRIKYVTKQSIETIKNKALDTLSDTLTTLAKATQRPERTAEQLPEEKQAIISKSDKLLKQLEEMHTFVEKEEFPETAVQEDYKQEIKSLKSKVQHVKNEAKKNVKEAHFLTGPIGATAQVIHERDLQKKLANTQKAIEKLHTAIFV